MYRQQKQVLLVLGWYDYRLHQGIAKYAQEHYWHLSANLARERVIPWGWKGDGILAWLGAGDDLVEFVESIKKPTVDFSLRRPHLKFPRVLQDHADSARLVAEHFLSHGFRQFMFFSDSDNWSYEERGQGFVRELQPSGHPCHWIKWHSSKQYQSGREEWTRRRTWLTVQLEQAPKPLAVFAANDQLAVDVLEACEHAGLQVPDHVAIVGAENYLLAVDGMRTPISSVDTNLERQGYEGALLLDRLMNGEPPPAAPIRIPAKWVVVRKSSDILAIGHPQVAKGLRFIRENFQRAIGVEEVVGTTAMSRRGLHQAFLQHLGRTPGEELRRVRIDRAKRLLAETGGKIEAIADLCGYQSANSFCVAFRKNTRMSPVAYRKLTLSGKPRDDSLSTAVT